VCKGHGNMSPYGLYRALSVSTNNLTYMAKIDPLVPIEFNVEGGKVNNRSDHGGQTNMGVTLATWKSQGYDKDGDGDIDAADLNLINHADVVGLLQTRWNMWKANSINNQSIANLVVDWVWNSGAWGIKKPQEVLGLTPDGVVGPKTISAINTGDQSEVFKKIWLARKKFFDDICKNDHTQLTFHAGWMNRLNSFKFKA